MEKTTYGKLREFELNSTGQEWTEYCKQMKFYFGTNEISDGKQKKSILLASVGKDTFKLIRNLIGKEQLKEETTTFHPEGEKPPGSETQIRFCEIEIFRLRKELRAVGS